MKKTLIFLLLIALTITSCKKDSGSNITGKWKLTEIFAPLAGRPDSGYSRMIVGIPTGQKYTTTILFFEL